MVHGMGRGMHLSALRHGHRRVAPWAAMLAILALLVPAVVPLAQAAPGLRGSDGQVLPLVLCRTAADPAGTPAAPQADHAQPCVICQALHGPAMAPPPVPPALDPRAARPVEVVWPEAPAPPCRHARYSPPARAPPVLATL